MNVRLDPYQVEGAHWLANGPDVLYLADQMRVGKTPQCVAACNLVAAERVLVICPGIARGGWLSEFKSFSADPGYAENSVIIYSVKDAEKITETTRLVVVSYDLAIRPDVFSMLYARGMVYGIDVLVLDEAHYIVNKLAKRTICILGPKCTGHEALAGLAKRTWFVSGTPERSDPSDLFPFCRMAGLWPQSRTDFINAFCHGFYDGGEYKITGAKNVEKLNRLIAPRIMRRLRSDLADLHINVGAMTVEARNFAAVSDLLMRLARLEPGYAKVVKNAVATGDFSNITLPSVSSVRRIVGLAKVPAMVDLVNDALEEDPLRKIVVFGMHRDPLRYLRNSLRRHKCGLIFGGTNQRAKDAMIEAFHTNHKNRVMVCNLAAASTAIDLSCADLVYIFEPSWIPVDNAQAMSRVIKLRDADTIKEVVFVGLANSIDDAVTRVCARRTTDIEASFRAV